MKIHLRQAYPFLGLAALLVLNACGGGGSSGMNAPMPQASPSMTAPNGQNSQFTSVQDTDHSDLDDTDADDTGASVLQRLSHQVTIGSTVDPTNGDQNPYGLDVAKSSAGKIQAGDLVICNFNNNTSLGNVQGQGTTIVALHPQAGSNPEHILQSDALRGCNALAVAPGDNIWAAAFVANDNPIVQADGTLVTPLSEAVWNHPFGEAFAQRPGLFGLSAFYVSNAGDGSIVRVNVTPGRPFTFDVIATGFAVNHGAPGGILGPSGLQYDALTDRLFIVDGANNTIYVLRHVSTIPARALAVNPDGKTFIGPFARRARVVFSGGPLNGPISAALLPQGHLAIGNTLDPAGTNLIVEISAHGRVLATKNVDTGSAGALFGMVATGVDTGDVRLYFNDDNDNTLRVLTP